MPIYTKRCDCGANESFYCSSDELEKNIGLCSCGLQMYRQYKINIASDDLGLQGIVNPADGKKYDSKSSYHRVLKEKGLVVNESNTAKKRPAFDEKKFDQAFQKTMEQLNV